jgi:hypothetical protein
MTRLELLMIVEEALADAPQSSPTIDEVLDRVINVLRADERFPRLCRAEYFLMFGRLRCDFECDGEGDVSAAARAVTNALLDDYDDDDEDEGAAA